MKRTIAIILMLTMLVGLFTACSKKKEEPKVSNNGGTVDVGNNNTGNNSDDGGLHDGELSNALIATAGNPSFFSLSPDQVNPSDTAVFKVAVNSEAASLNPLISGSSAAMYPTTFMYDNLVQYNIDTNEIIPWLATEWEWTSDTTLVMKLRDDVYSHMGDHYTAHDAVYSISWGCDTKALASYVSSVIDLDNTKAIDDYTLQIGLKASNPFFLLELARLCYVQVVEASVEKIGGRDSDAAKDTSLYATGPYVFQKWNKGVSFETERNDNWWHDTTPYYKEIDVFFINDPTSRAFGVEAGDFDYAMDCQLETILSAVGIEADHKGFLVDNYFMVSLTFNSNKEIFANKAVRQAIAMAIDYEACNTVAYKGYGVVPEGVIPPTVEWFSGPEDGSENYAKFDLEAAKAKMIEAGYADGLSFELLVFSGDGGIVTVSEILQNNLKKIGVTCELTPYDPATFNEIILSNDWDAHLNGIPGYNPVRALIKLDPNRSMAEGRGHCGTNWYDGEGGNAYISELVNHCLSNPDLSDSKDEFATLQNIVREYIPYITITEGVTGGIISSDIQNVGIACAGSASTFFAFYEEGYLK